MKTDRFILFPWGIINRKGERAERFLESIKDCGFNASCFVPESEFETCRRLGLEIYGTVDKNHGADSELDIKELLSDPAITEADIRAAMHKALAGLPEDVRSVYLTDEPGAALYPKLKTLVECVHEEAPWAEAYLNLFPNYAVCGAPNLSQLETETYEEYIERFAAEVKPDAVSVDNYQVLISDNFTIEGGRESYFNNMLQARAVCDKYNLPFQFIACCNQLRYWQTIPTFGNLALQGYTALAAGARFFSWFLYYSCGYYFYAPVDDLTGEDIITPNWYTLREINRRILPLGELLFDMEYKGMYFSKTDGLTGALPISECSAVSEFSSDEECMIGHYADCDGKDVILVANCTPCKSIRVNIRLGDKKLQSYSTERLEWLDIARVNNEEQESPVWLEPGCGILLR